MATKKPSLTKQIGEALLTDDKREQLERIQGMIQGIRAPAAAVTVLFAKGQTKVTVLSTGEITADDVKFILQKGVDEITAQIVRQQLAQEDADKDQMSMDAALEELGSDGNPAG